MDQPFRAILIPLEFLIAIIFMEISAYFLYRYWTNKKTETPSTVELDWSIVFGSFGVAFFFYIYGDFFQSGNRNSFLFCAYLAQVIGGTLFIYHLELTKTLKTNFKLTIFFGSFIIFFMVFYVFFPTILQSSAYPISLLAYAIIIIYFLRVIKRIWSFYKAHSLGLLLAIFIWFIGYAGNTDIAIRLFGTIWIRVIGDALIIIGIGLVAFFVNTIPSLNEIGWREKIKYIILATASGVSIYSENFQEQKAVNELLLAGGIWGLDMFLKNILDEASLKTISRGSDVILVEKGNLIMGIFVVEQDLKLLRYLLRKLILQFEFYYSSILVDWKGDLNLFKPTQHLINSIFAYKKI
jgi:hypothetical protein